MTDDDVFGQALRNFLVQVRPGQEIETLALASTLLAELNDPRSIEDARERIRREATALGIDWRDEK